MRLLKGKWGTGLVVAALTFTLVACDEGEETTSQAPSPEVCQSIEAQVSIAAQAVTEAEATLAEKESGRNKQTLREAEERLEELRTTQVACGQPVDTTPDTTLVTTDTSVPDVTDSTVSADTTSTTVLPSPPSGISDEIVAMLTVNTFSVGECLELTGSQTTGVVPYSIGALELPVPEGPRLWNDAYDVPLPDVEPAAQLEAFKAGVCANPHLGFGWGHFFANMEIGGRKLIDLNPWLETFNVPEAEIHVMAAGYIPLLDAVNPDDALKAQAVEMNRAWQSEAEKLNALIDRFSLLWVDSLTSVVNYHLVAGGVVVGGLPEVGLNPNQESLPALILMINEKGACVPIKLIGINVGDRRPEEFAPPPCAPPPPPCDNCTTTTTRPPCDNCTTTTTTPPCVGCGTTTTTTTTVPDCDCPTTTVANGKPGVPSTVAPPPVTAAPAPTPAPQGPTTSVGDSGAGAPPPATTVAPTPTVAPPVAPPAASTTIAPPTTRVDGP